MHAVMSFSFLIENLSSFNSQLNIAEELHRLFIFSFKAWYEIADDWELSTPVYFTLQSRFAEVEFFKMKTIYVVLAQLLHKISHQSYMICYISI